MTPEQQLINEKVHDMSMEELEKYLLSPEHDHELLKNCSKLLQKKTEQYRETKAGIRTFLQDTSIPRKYRQRLIDLTFKTEVCRANPEGRPVKLKDLLLYYLYQEETKAKIAVK